MRAKKLFLAFMYCFESKFDFQTFVCELTAVLNELENTGEISFADRKSYVETFINEYEDGSGTWEPELKRGLTQAMIYDNKCDNPRRPSKYTSTIIRLAESDELRRWCFSKVR